MKDMETYYMHIEPWQGHVMTSHTLGNLTLDVYETV